jgi:hypothetical protein
LWHGRQYKLQSSYYRIPRRFFSLAFLSCLALRNDPFWSRFMTSPACHHRPAWRPAFDHQRRARGGRRDAVVALMLGGADGSDIFWLAGRAARRAAIRCCAITACAPRS